MNHVLVVQPDGTIMNGNTRIAVLCPVGTMSASFLA